MAKHKKIYSERLRYGIAPVDSFVPENVRYLTYHNAVDAAIRFGEKSNKKYWVLEITECLTAVWEDGGDKQ